jgi:hypothetical protein
LQLNKDPHTVCQWLQSAFVLIGYVGALLILEEAVHLVTRATIHVPPYAKFAGILFIMWTALLYAADGGVRRVVRPLGRAATAMMHAVTRAVSVLRWPPARLVEHVAALWRRPKVRGRG